MVNVSIRIRDAIYIPRQQELLLIFTAMTDRGELTTIPEGHRLEVSVNTGAAASKPVVIGHLQSLLTHTDTDRFRAIPPRKAGEPYELTLKGVKAENTSKVSIVLISSSGARVTETSVPIKPMPIYI